MNDLRKDGGKCPAVGRYTVQCAAGCACRLHTQASWHCGNARCWALLGAAGPRARGALLHPSWESPDYGLCWSPWAAGLTSLLYPTSAWPLVGTLRAPRRMPQLTCLPWLERQRAAQPQSQQQRQTSLHFVCGTTTPPPRAVTHCHPLSSRCLNLAVPVHARNAR